MYSLNRFLEQKREKIRLAKEYAEAKKAAKGIEDEEDLSDAESLDDDEFDSYLDRLGVASGNDGDADLDGEVDFMNEFEQDLAKKAEKKKRKKSQADEEDGDDDDDEFGDWDDAEGADDDDDDDGDDDEGDFSDMDGLSDDGSISLDEDGSGDDDGDDDEDDDEEGSDEDDEDPSPKSKKRRKDTDGLTDKAFQKKLKTNDFNSLFAAADDFSEMLEKNVNAKDKSHGTLGEIFNKDNAHAKQMAWEQARFSGKNKMQSGKKRFISKKQGSSSGVEKKFKSGKVGKKKPFAKASKGGGKAGGKRRK